MLVDLLDPITGRGGSLNLLFWYNRSACLLGPNRVAGERLPGAHSGRLSMLTTGQFTGLGDHVRAAAGRPGSLPGGLLGKGSPCIQTPAVARTAEPADGHSGALKLHMGSASLPCLCARFRTCRTAGFRV